MHSFGKVERTCVGTYQEAGGVLASSIGVSGLKRFTSRRRNGRDCCSLGGTS